MTSMVVRRGVRCRVLAAVALSCSLAACLGSQPRSIEFEDRPATSLGDGDPPVTSLRVGASDEPSDHVEQFVVRTDATNGVFDRRVLGTNVPAWLGPDLLADREFQTMTRSLGTTVLRLPGGSWSNHYDWLACELGQTDGCHWTWAARPTDFLELLGAVGAEGMWTVSINGTAEEAAALVAFFNGSVDDARAIGVDRNGRDWATVGRWARLRAEHGNPEPRPIRLWEVGNEVFGAVPDTGPSCSPFGWEEVWTCDGREYVEGSADHDGFVHFRNAMLAVDPDILVGAVGVAEQSSWGGWGNDVLAAAGAGIDFYVVHHYGFDGDVHPESALAVPRIEWPSITNDLEAAFTLHGLEDVAVAVTEYNLVSVLEADREAAMATALNAFYLADTIGQFVLNGVAIANQWNLANGRADNGSDYGLVDVETRERSPAYYALALWSRFGDELLVVERGGNAALQGLSVFASRDRDGSFRILAINSSSRAITAVVDFEPWPGPMAVTADVVTATSLRATTVSYNGSDDPDLTLSHPPAHDLGTVGRESRHEMPPLSITLLRWDPER